MTSRWRLTSATTGRLVVARLTIADGFCSRFIGLQFHDAMPPDAGILLVPCGAVHSCFLWFSLDIVFLDRRRVVLDVRRNVRPWRLAAGPRGSHAVLEMPAGSADVQPGEVLRLESTETLTAPKSVAFLR